MWFYKHSSYFPEEIRVTLVNLGYLTFFLASDQRQAALDATKEWSVEAWNSLREYQRKVERKLGLIHPPQFPWLKFESSE